MLTEKLKNEVKLFVSPGLASLMLQHHDWILWAKTYFGLVTSAKRLQNIQR